MTSKTIHEDLRALANGINHVMATRYAGKVPEFMLIMVQYNDDDTVTLNTITGIQDAAKIHTIGQHLIDMAKAQQEPSLDPDNDSDIKGHA